MSKLIELLDKIQVSIDEALDKIEKKSEESEVQMGDATNAVTAAQKKVDKPV